ncbi:MAG: TIGR01906 family membrane protein [Christensenellaceae bacterium]|nr:TIGR01906 family membrane protein [Christensenellaceae bacterium]
MNKKLSCTLAAIAGFCLIFGLLCTVICVCASSRNFYYKEYEKLGVHEDIGISMEDLKEATNVLLEYTEGKREDMVVYADINGVNEPVFNQRETDHMYDVRILFINAKNVGIITLVFGAAVLVLAGIFSKDRRYVFKGYLYGNIAFFAIVAVIAVYAATDFTSFWTSFHHVFFTNDLWLLDPATDNLILMVPEQFFFDLVFKIIGVFVAIAAVLAALSIIMNKVIKKKRLKNGVC